jgi:hypothetical protein
MDQRIVRLSMPARADYHVFIIPEAYKLYAIWRPTGGKIREHLCELTLK